MKTSEEWSLAFDLLYNNITSNQAPGLELYEKSVFLTQAQGALVKDYFSTTHNAHGEGFDESIRRQADFRSIITSTKLRELTYSSDSQVPFRQNGNTRYFEFPYNALFVVNDEVNVTIGNLMKRYTVVPISYAEYSRLMMRPYKYPPKDMLWRLITNSDDVYEGSVHADTYQIVELIGRFAGNSTVEYRMRYVRRPRPIVLGVMPDGLSVEGVSSESICELPEHLHDEILARAVQLAKIAWVDNVSQQA